MQLVNNEVFPPALNDDLKNMFLDLKDGARIVSLKPFVNEGFRMNESNVRGLSLLFILFLPNSKQHQPPLSCIPLYTLHFPFPNCPTIQPYPLPITLGTSADKSCATLSTL